MKEKAYRLLMVLQGLFWFYLAIRSIVSGGVAVFVFALMLIDGALFILLAFPDIRRPRYKWVTLAFLAFNTVLTFTDQMGFWDYLVLAWNILLLLLALFILFRRKPA